jgi:bifunctional N-acetylglucosamine-1-phosphate-uridyltransferase/glucosamine-1-phosphate-acetyltransferase GlmU-like protein
VSREWSWAPDGRRAWAARSQTLPFGGTTLLGHVVASAEASGLEVVVVVGGAEDDVRAVLAPARATVVTNTAYGTGCASVWKIVDDDRDGQVARLPVGRPCPRDVDTWDDYRALVADA